MYREKIKGLEKWYNKSDRLPIILKGARQVGKTYLAKDFVSKTNKDLVYFNFESEVRLRQVFDEQKPFSKTFQDLEFLAGKKITEESVLVLDEIQECPRALNSLKYFAENKKETPVIAAGSLLGVSLNPVSFPVGKVEYLSIHPFKFDEFLIGLNDERALESFYKLTKLQEISQLEHNHLWDKFILFSITGGLPRVICDLLENIEDQNLAFSKIRERQNFILRDYQSDFSKHSLSANAVNIRAIFNNIPYQLSQSKDLTTNKYKFANVIPNKKGFAQLQTPIEWLVNAGLIYKIQIANRAEIPLKAFCSDSFFKLFLFDTGILNAMLNIPINSILSEESGITKGYLAENIVLQESMNDEFNLPVVWKEGQSEIEFLLQDKADIIPLEVKSGLRVQAKSLNSYLKKYHPKYGIKLSKKNYSYNKNTKIYNLPLYLACKIKEIFSYY